MGQSLRDSGFRGHHPYSIDEKGRLSIPVQFREILAKVYKKEKLMLTGLGNCLVAYPLSEWLKIEKKVNNLPQFKPEVSRFLFGFISRAEECGFDRQGRILIPSGLRSGLRKEVVIVGKLKRFEIWDKERYEEEMKKFTEDLEKISNVVGDLGL